MASMRASHALQVERTGALVASVFSEGRRQGVRLISGERRCFGTNEERTLVNIPYPATHPDRTLRTLTCGVALQCSPSKDRLAQFSLQELSPRELVALTIAEGEVALGWIASRWPGLLPDLRRLLPNLEVASGDLDGPAMMDRAMALVRSGHELRYDNLLGQLQPGAPRSDGFLASVRRMYGRMPWSERKRVLPPRFDSIPIGGEGGVRNANLPPPSRPEEEDVEPRLDRRLGVPYPEWNVWTKSFLQHHVAVLERKSPPRVRSRPAAANLRRWFEQHTHRVMRNRLEDGSELDIDRYVEHHVETSMGKPSEARVFRDLLPGVRDVTTAILLDGSASLGSSQGGIFRLELACADALCHSLGLARQRHGLFMFNGNTRHRVDVTCLKDFGDPRLVAPGDQGLVTGGYTRLGAPLRHLPRRLLAEPSERRLLIAIGDGLMSDAGYEGRYAWADTAHAVEEAGDAGVTIHYIGVGRTRVDPLPDVFGPRLSTRIKGVEELPRVLARVHRELAAA